MVGTTWAPDTEALLTRLWTEEGCTFAEIAKAVTEAGHAVSRAAVSGRIRRMGLVGKQWPKPASSPAATKPETGGDPSTATLVSSGPEDESLGDQARSAALGPPAVSPAATIVAAEINTLAPGAWPIANLREGQCRFACTPDHVPADQHRFCGEPTRVGPGNLHGSWCPKHLERMYDTTSRLARPRFLNRIGSGR